MLVGVFILHNANVPGKTAQLIYLIPTHAIIVVYFNLWYIF